MTPLSAVDLSFREGGLGAHLRLPVPPAGEVGQEEDDGTPGQEVHQLPVEIRAGGYGGDQPAFGAKVDGLAVKSG